MDMMLLDHINVPAFFAKALGYLGQSRFVSTWWDNAIDDLVLEDAKGFYPGSLRNYIWLKLIATLVGDRYPAFVFDLQAGKVWGGSISQARAFMKENNKVTPDLCLSPVVMAQTPAQAVQTFFAQY